MPRKEPSTFLLSFLAAVSVLGLALVPLLLLQPNLQADLSPFRRPFIGAVYSAICIAGIIAVFYPRKCRMTFQKPSIYRDYMPTAASTVQFKGHHPNCEKFSGNRIIIRGSPFCAACSGLLIGGIVSMIVIVWFSLGFFNLVNGSLWILVVGEILLLVGLAQTKMSGYIKVAVNSLFVVGSCVSLVISDLVGQSLLVDGYVLGLIVFMLWFRILMSEWNNKRMCLTCGNCV